MRKSILGICNSRANLLRQEVCLVYLRNSKEGTLAVLGGNGSREPGNVGPYGVTAGMRNIP